ncbi:MAG TPA: SpoIIE family protein phosphatase [Dongiaceae bacterium]|nr:SpoIIE family protein phosphatase [Dongiaceae bacterium]
MGHLHHVIPTLKDIMRTAPEIASATLVKDVMELFQKEQSLLALPVSEEGMFIGAINRRVLFFEHLGRPFAVDLYGRKAIRALLPENQLALEPELDINAALVRLLEVDPGLAIDSFPVVAGNSCLGIVAVSDLMMKISENQAMLLNTLQMLSARITEEVDKASKIQRDLLPPSEFLGSDISISAEVITSSEIGGDFYDYFPLGEGRMGLLVADVSGHGVQAGMVTTAAKASLHSLIGKGVTTPAELLYGMNNAILATARQSLLMTCLIIIIDPIDNKLTLANAGHNFPYIIRGKTAAPEMIQDVAGYPLGFEANCDYPEFTCTFIPGDTLFLYTDGIVECIDRHGEEFGYERLKRILAKAGGYSPLELRNLLRQSAELFTCSSTFEDDVTLLIAASVAKN